MGENNLQSFSGELDNLNPACYLNTSGGCIRVPTARARTIIIMQIISGILLLLTLSLSGVAQRSALTAPRNIAQLSQQAALIVRGQVISARIEPHPQLSNLTTVVVNVRVAETLKGTASAVVTFRQFVWDIRDKYDAAGYRKGEELLLLLNRRSTYGLTSPAGMDQGRFEISRDTNGNLMAVNGHGNLGLFSNMSGQLHQPGLKFSPRAYSLVTLHRSGPVSLVQLEEVIKQVSGAVR